MKKLENCISCVRCGISCQPGKRKNPKARPFQEVAAGLCADCAVTHFFLAPDCEALMLGLLKNGIEILHEPPIQRQFAKILRAGKSDLQIEGINWERIIEQWDLPFPKGYEPTKRKRKEDKP